MSSKHSFHTPQSRSLPKSRSSSILFSPSYNRNHQTTGNDCPLNDPDLGVISENDHRVGLCLCPTCTCGQHKCPSQLMKEPYPKSIFNSYYNQEFKARTPVQPIKINNCINFSSKIPMECTTSYENFFKPPEVSHKVSTIGVVSPAPKPVFSGVSSYKVDFPSWGSGGAYYVKQSHIRHSDPDMKMNARSSYAESFKPISDQDIKQAQHDAANVGLFRPTGAIKFSTSKMLSESTSKADFQDFSHKNLMVKACQDFNAIPKHSVSSSHFKSTSQTAFRATTATKDHRATRRLIEKERLFHTPGYR